MAVVENYAAGIKITQIASGSDWARYAVEYYRRNNAFWGLRNMCQIDVNGELWWWACPDKSMWNWDGSGYYLLEHGTWGTAKYLSYEFWAPQNGYLCDDYLYFERTVGINRGNSRQGSTSVRCSAYNINGWWDTINCYETLYTTKIADVSNINFSVSCDAKTANPRYIRINASYNNPEGFYTGHISGPGINTDFTGSGSWTQEVTTSMFNTTRTYTLTIRGRDGTQYHSSSRDVYVEPGGVGVWYKQNNQPKEVYHVYYKNNYGAIIEVTEIWYKRNSQNIKTTK